MKSSWYFPRSQEIISHIHIRASSEKHVQFACGFGRNPHTLKICKPFLTCTNSSWHFPRFQEIISHIRTCVCGCGQNPRTITIGRFASHSSHAVHQQTHLGISRGSKKKICTLAHMSHMYVWVRPKSKHNNNLEICKSLLTCCASTKSSWYFTRFQKIILHIPTCACGCGPNPSTKTICKYCDACFASHSSHAVHQKSHLGISRGPRNNFAHSNMWGFRKTCAMCVWVRPKSSHSSNFYCKSYENVQASKWIHSEITIRGIFKTKVFFWLFLESMVTLPRNELLCQLFRGLR